MTEHYIELHARSAFSFLEGASAPASFALIAYASAYLKCHYLAAFTAAILNNQPMGGDVAGGWIEVQVRFLSRVDCANAR